MSGAVLLIAEESIVSQVRAKETSVKRKSEVPFSEVHLREFELRGCVRCAMNHW